MVVRALRHLHLKPKNHFSLLFLSPPHFQLVIYSFNAAFHSARHHSLDQGTGHSPLDCQKGLLKWPEKAFLKCSLQPKSSLLVPLSFVKRHSKPWLGSLHSYRLATCLPQFSKGQFHPSELGPKSLESPRFLSSSHYTYSIHNSSALCFYIQPSSRLPPHHIDLHHHIVRLENPKDLLASTTQLQRAPKEQLEGPF